MKPSDKEITRQLAEVRKHLAAMREMVARPGLRRAAFKMKDAAPLLGVSLPRLRWLIRVGAVLAFSSGRRHLVPRSEIAGFSSDAADRLAAFDAAF